MKRGLRKLAGLGVICAGLWPLGQAAVAQEGSLSSSGTVRVSGLEGQAKTFTASDLARLPHVHVTLTHLGKTDDYAGPELTALLREVDAPLGARMHGPAVATVVLVSASDGYRAALSLGEIDPEVHSGVRVILADQEDGRPLPPNEAPYRLMIEGEAKPARDVHSVVSIELKRLP